MCALRFREFCLLRHREIATAVVPLSAQQFNANIDDRKMEEINIAGWFPERTQWVEVSQRSGAKDVLGAPAVKVNVLGTGVELSGLGVNKRYADTQSYKISLNPKEEALENLPKSLYWLVLRHEPEAIRDAD